MAVAGSVYHPLTYVYGIASRLLCENSQDQTCNKTTSPIVSGKNGAVVTTQHNASDIGLEILKAGGNAIDAAVAIGYASAVADPCCGNIGGGGFILSYFGSGEIAGNTGFFLNNEMDDFAAKPGVPNNFGLVQGNLNAIEPGKRPLSSMTPTIVTKNGKVFFHRYG